MQTIKKIILVTLLVFQAIALASVPLAAYAEGDSLPTKQNAKKQADIRKQVLASCSSAYKPDEAVQCLTSDEQKNGFFTVLEEGIQAPEDFQQTGDTSVRPCYRLTAITECKVEGQKSVKKTDQYLLKNCPSDKENRKESAPVGETSYSECQEVTVLYSTQGGIGLLQVYLGLIYKWAAGIVGVIAVLIIVISGIQIATSQEEDKVADAKKRIGQSVAGIALLFLISALLYVINPTFFNPPSGPTAPPPQQTEDNGIPPSQENA